MTGKECKRRRQSARLSLQAVAMRTGVNKAYLCEWENGIRRLDADRVAVIVQFFDGLNPCGCLHPGCCR